MHSHSHVLLISVLPQQPPQTLQVLIVTILKPENREIPCETWVLFSQSWASAPHPPRGTGGQLFQGTQIWCGFPSHNPGAQHPELLLEAGTPHFRSTPPIQGGFAAMLKVLAKRFPKQVLSGVMKSNGEQLSTKFPNATL